MTLSWETPITRAGSGGVGKSGVIGGARPCWKRCDPGICVGPLPTQTGTHKMRHYRWLRASRVGMRRAEVLRFAQE